MNVMESVRPAVVDDAESLASAHVRAWQAAYAGAMPADFLADLEAADRVAGWRKRIAQTAADSALFVADVDGVAVGFAIVGPERDAGPEGDAEHADVVERRGELFALNVDPDHWRDGHGRRLLVAATDELTRRGYRQAVLWVLDSNERARRFYGRFGWNADGETKREELKGPSGPFTLDEVRYVRNLADEA